MTSQEAPQVQDDTAVTGKGTAIDVPVLSNDFELRGGALAFVDFTQPPHGTVSRVGAGSLHYIPQPGFLGEDIFNYRVTNGLGTSQAAIRINVIDRRPPVAQPDSAATAYQTPVQIPVLLNDASPEGASLTIVRALPPANGTVNGVYGNNVTYTPNAGFSGNDSFDYIISDGILTGRGTVRVTVKQFVPNRAPVTGVDYATTISGQSIAIHPLNNDYDPEGKTLVISDNSSPAHGWVYRDVFDTLRYTSQSGFVGADEFTYTISDGIDTAQGTVRVTIGANQPPIARDDDVVVTSGVGTTVYVRDNDNDPESGNNLHTFLVTPPLHGTALPDQNQRNIYLLYRAEDGFVGDDEFTYRVSDGNSSSAPARVRVTVRPNTPPTAVDDYAYVPIGATSKVLLRVLDNDFDVDGGPYLQVVDVNDAAKGALDVMDGYVYYTPGPEYNGADQLTYSVSDRMGGTATASVTIGAGPNGAPHLVDDFAVLHFGESVLNIPVLENDSDPDGDALTFTFGSGAKSLIYRPNFDSVPTSQFDTAIYWVTDGHGNISGHTVQIDISAVIPRGAPRAWPSRVALPRNATQVTVPLSWNYGVVSAVTNGAKGTTFLKNSGDVVYSPNSAYDGFDQFSFTVTNSVGKSESAQVTVVWGEDRPPIAVSDTFAVGTGSSTKTLGVLANDSDPDGDPLTLVSATNGLHGTVLVNGDRLLYTPDATFSGSDSFTYTISSGTGLEASSSVVLQADYNSPPIARNDTVLLTSLASVTVYVLTNDTDADFDPLTILNVSSPTKGTAFKNGTLVIYTPNANFSGTDSFTYTISDGRGGTATATVTVSKSDVNSPPVARDDGIRIAGEVSVSIDVLANDSDPDGDVLTIVSASSASKGAVAVSGNSVVYTPGEGAAGTDSFTYAISDGHGGTAAATVTVNINNAPNTAPVANDDQVWLNIGPIINLNSPPSTRVRVLDNDFDADGDPLRIVRVTDGSSGAVTIEGTELVYTWRPGGEYSDEFTYSIEDGVGGEATGRVVVNFPKAPQSSLVFATGVAVPGGDTSESGIPAGAVFRRFGTPSINDAGALAFLGTYAAGPTIVHGLFAGNPVQSLTQEGAIAPGPDGQRVDSAPFDQFDAFHAPLLNNPGDVVFIANIRSLSGQPKAGIWLKPHDGPLRRIICTGQEAVGVSGAMWKGIISVGLTNSGAVPFVAKLQGNGGSKNALGLWEFTDAGVHLLLRQGDSLAIDGVTKKVEGFAALAPVQGSAGHGRLSKNAVPARVRWTDGTQSLLSFTPNEPPVVIASAGDAVPSGGKFENVGFPELNQAGQFALIATVGSGKAGIFADSLGDSLTRLAESGTAAPDGNGIPDVNGATFSTFQSPVYNFQQRTAFIAKMTGRGAAPGRDQGIWWTALDGRLTRLAQTYSIPDLGTGAAIDHNPRWTSFTSLAFPDGFTAGPIFTAKVTTGGPPESRISFDGLWAVDSVGQVRCVVRTGQTVDVNGSSKTIRKVDCLSTLPRSPAQPRSYNGKRQLVYRATFTDGTEAILQATLH